jgi:hypothetical protein
VGIDDDEPIPSVTYDEWEETDGLSLPWKRTIVRGLAEAPELSMETQSCSALAEIDGAFFLIPKENSDSK